MKEIPRFDYSKNKKLAFDYRQKHGFVILNNHFKINLLRI